jgi:phosphoribosylaminoimidazole-succinocarboxamide synthase
MTPLAVLPEALTEISLPLPRARSGKVRQCFDLGDRLLLVATDRISAFDCVFERGIPGKGAVLTGISRFWFDRIGAGGADAPAVAHHLLSTDVGRICRDLALPPGSETILAGRTMLVRKASPVPVECVVRGYLEGSALYDYLGSGRVAGEKLPPGLRRADRLRRPIFTPAIKAQTGHDENITFDRMAQMVGGELSETLRTLSLQLYEMGSRLLASRGLLLADTKFEFGLAVEKGGEDRVVPPEKERDSLLLIDEVLTPDSSRVWDASAWEPGHAQASFDKQPLRDYLEGFSAAGRWDKRPPAPPLPDEVVRETAERYARAHLLITGEAPEGWDRSALEGAAPSTSASLRGSKDGVHAGEAVR